MRTLVALMLAAAAGLGVGQSSQAQSLIGIWQTTIDGNKQVANFTKTIGNHLHGEYYNVGGDPVDGNPISTIDVEGRHVRFAFDEVDLAFDGQLSLDGNTLDGRWLRGEQSGPITYHRATAKTAWQIDPSPHKVLFVSTQQGVRLEVLDWGGNGPPLIFVPGLGNTAHVFDSFAPKFTGMHHVYGITRRGFGMSSKPDPNAENYDANRLGDDVLAVIDALKLDRPVLVGHSLGGEELSSVGTRHPEKVSGLIYLDADYQYAFYDPKGVGNTSVDSSIIRRDLADLMSAPPSRWKSLIDEIESTVPGLRKDLAAIRMQADGQPDGPPAPRPMLQDRIREAIVTSERRYSGTNVPALAIFASPHACATNCESEAWKAFDAFSAAQANAVEASVPTTRVVRVANSDHYVFRSNEADVVRQMDAFLASLH